MPPVPMALNWLRHHLVGTVQRLAGHPKSSRIEALSGLVSVILGGLLDMTLRGFRAVMARWSIRRWPCV